MRKSISIATPGSGPALKRLWSWLRQRAPLFPQDCILCGQPGGADPVCPACMAELPAIPAHACPRCAEVTPAGAVCGACQQHPPAFDHIRAIYPYAFPVDQLIQQLKYAGQLSLAPFWGQQLARMLHNAPAGSSLPPSLIMPLPLHSTRLAERGFNQSAEIARYMARSSGLRLDVRSLVKHQPTRPQAGLTLAQRHTSPAGSFSCQCDLGGLHVILVDDVMTTGATLNEAARVLKQQGCHEISAYVVARTQKHG